MAKHEEDHENEDSYSGKEGDYRLCDCCGRNVPIRKISGVCQHPGCGEWICKDCAQMCKVCGRIFCPAHVEDIEGKNHCHKCKPKSEYCFIATAAYGTPFAQEIEVLRYWRDNFLQTFSLGRLFVNIYYKISPPIANFIEKRNWLRKSIRFILDPYVSFLDWYYKK